MGWCTLPRNGTIGFDPQLNAVQVTGTAAWPPPPPASPSAPKTPRRRPPRGSGAPGGSLGLGVGGVVSLEGVLGVWKMGRRENLGVD